MVGMGPPASGEINLVGAAGGALIWRKGSRSFGERRLQGHEQALRPRAGVDSSPKAFLEVRGGTRQVLRFTGGASQRLAQAGPRRGEQQRAGSDEEPRATPGLRDAGQLAPCNRTSPALRPAKQAQCS